MTGTLHATNKRERERSVGQGKTEREIDETQQIMDEERKGGKTGREKFISVHIPFYLPPISPLIGPVGWRSIFLYDHIQGHSSKISGILY